MKKITVGFSLALTVLLSMLSTSVIAETGACGSRTFSRAPDDNSAWNATITNNLSEEVRLSVPRNEWICWDYWGTANPGLIDGKVLKPGESLQVRVNNATSNDGYSEYRPFTLIPNICTTPTCTASKSRRIRVGVWNKQYPTYLYDLSQYIGDGYPDGVLDLPTINGKKTEMRFKMVPKANRTFKYDQLITIQYK